MSIYFLFSLGASAYCCLIATFALIRGHNRQHHVFAFLCYVIAIWSSFPWVTQSCSQDIQLLLARIIYIAAAGVPSLFLAFVLTSINRPILSKALILSAVTTLFFTIFFNNPALIQGVRSADGNSTPITGNLYIGFVTFFGLVCGYAFVLLMQTYRRVEYAEKNKLKYIFVSFILAYASGLLHFVAAYTGKEPVPHDFLLVLFASTLAYAILKHRLMDFTVIIRKTLIYSVVMSSLVILYVTFVGLFTRLFEGIAGNQTVFTSAVVAGLIAFCFQPLRKRVQTFVDRKFFRQYVDREEKLYELSREVITHTTPEAMGAALQQVLKETFHPKNGALYVRSRDGSGFLPVTQWGATESHMLNEDNPLARYFIDRPQPFLQDLSGNTGKSRDTRISDARGRNP